MTAVDQRSPAPIAEEVPQINKPQDSWTTVLVVDPWATPLVRGLAGRTTITPGQLTATAGMCAVVACGAFLTGHHRLTLLGAVFFLLSYLCDCLDGKLARHQGVTSVRGAWLNDLMGRARILGCPAALFLGLHAHTNRALYLLLGITVTALLLITQITGSREPGPVRLRLLARFRLRTRPFSEVEFGLAVCVVAPQSGAYLPVVAVACALLLCCEVVGLPARHLSRFR